MRRWMVVACAFLLATVALVVAQDQQGGGRRGRRGGGAGAAAADTMKPAITSEEDYSKTMKEVAQQNMALRKAIGATPSEADATAAASRLEALFKDVQAYWQTKKTEDASTFATNAVAAAQAVQKAVAAHDMPGANAAAMTLAQQCAGCHKEHREQNPDKTFKMK